MSIVTHILHLIDEANKLGIHEISFLYRLTAYSPGEINFAIKQLLFREWITDLDGHYLITDEGMEALEKVKKRVQDE